MNESKTESKNMPKIIGLVVLGVIVITILGYGVIQGLNFFGQVRGNWNEIKFAFEKGTVVQPLRLEYEARQKGLEESFVKESKDERLIKEAAIQISTEQKLSK